MTMHPPLLANQRALQSDPSGKHTHCLRMVLDSSRKERTSCESSSADSNRLASFSVKEGMPTLRETWGDRQRERGVEKKRMMACINKGHCRKVSWSASQSYDTISWRTNSPLASISPEPCPEAIYNSDLCRMALMASS